MIDTAKYYNDFINLSKQADNSKYDLIKKEAILHDCLTEYRIELAKLQQKYNSVLIEKEIAKNNYDQIRMKDISDGCLLRSIIMLIKEFLDCDLFKSKDHSVWGWLDKNAGILCYRNDYGFDRWFEECKDDILSPSEQISEELKLNDDAGMFVIKKVFYFRGEVDGSFELNIPKELVSIKAVAKLKSDIDSYINKVRKQEEEEQNKRNEIKKKETYELYLKLKKEFEKD